MISRLRNSGSGDGAIVDRWSAGTGLVTAATLTVTVTTTVLVPVLRGKSAPGGAPKAAHSADSDLACALPHAGRR
ncbi:hypothetical protein Psi02_69460 [Planotetraspora silvatica]|uniref:Uncharacterized protein n=1 Tax=Planotetraspora silvatica TaxID=234614 RepID=A0A8J3USI6_9ACTN|nr:hypothetical protein [Planotetraspora silvatica]GII50522.1 hypothetical protein Psi02_69460 [Planotetraspora silvatica]